MEKETQIKVGISHGDINGIGYEVILKSLLDQRIYEHLCPIVYGSSKLASYYRKTTNIAEFSFNMIKSPDAANPKRANMINVIQDEVKVEPGKQTETGGEMALISLEAAVKDLKNNQIDVLVTAPINKKNIQSPDFHFPGHTEYLAERFETKDSLMIMVYNNVRIGVVTSHTPLNQVSSLITEELLIRKIKIMHDSLQRDFNIPKPKIALLSINPHAGDEGVIGDEDQRIIAPTARKAFEEGMIVYGPYPADGFFGSGNFNKFDGVLAMYHDQGLIPFKLISNKEGVNFTAGLPIVRTSPAHGTAYDIAGKDKASASSFRSAMFLACDIFNNRLQWNELHANPLKPAAFTDFGE